MEKPSIFHPSQPAERYLLQQALGLTLLLDDLPELGVLLEAIDDGSEVSNRTWGITLWLFNIAMENPL